jgi:hypothetical protein
MNIESRDYWKTHTRYYGQTIPVLLGYTPKNRKPITYPIQKWGTTKFVAKSRVGKTTEIKSLISQVNRAGRKIVILDPYRDYVEMGEPNFRGKDGAAFIHDLHVEQDFAFTISQFKAKDFSTFGFTEKGLTLMADIAPRVALHKNDPEFVSDFIADLPDRQPLIAPFNRKYGMKIRKPINESKINAMAETYRLMRGYFYDEAESPEKGIHCLDNVCDICLKHDVTVFYFDVATHGQTKFQIYSAIILRLLKQVLAKLKALFVFEEGDILFPNSLTPPTSFYEVDEYCRKLGRTDTHMIIVSQNDADFHPSIARNYHGMVLGKLNPGSRYYELVEDLYWDPERGIRQMLFMDSNNRTYVFEPLAPPTK